jgi:hypothetical protein
MAINLFPSNLEPHLAGSNRDLILWIGNALRRLCPELKYDLAMSNLDMKGEHHIPSGELLSIKYYHFLL